jgi:hypothetical protein
MDRRTDKQTARLTYRWGRGTCSAVQRGAPVSCVQQW